ncbi:MAG: hypothetical protein MZV64_63155 [Ignavibacteriales bacterium]|nr:hypothetical protein [Ignavibacteriales bacterium]
MAGDIAWALVPRPDQRRPDDGRGHVHGRRSRPRSSACCCSSLFMVFVGVLFGSLAMIVTSFAPNFDFFSYYTELVDHAHALLLRRLLPARQVPRLDEDPGAVHAPDPRRPHLPGAVHRRARGRARLEPGRPRRPGGRRLHRLHPHDAKAPDQIGAPPWPRPDPPDRGGRRRRRSSSSSPPRRGRTRLCLSQDKETVGAEGRRTGRSSRSTRS